MPNRAAFNKTIRVFRAGKHLKRKFHRQNIRRNEYIKVVIAVITRDFYAMQNTPNSLHTMYDPSMKL